MILVLALMLGMSAAAASSQPVMEVERVELDNARWFSRRGAIVLNGGSHFSMGGLTRLSGRDGTAFSLNVSPAIEFFVIDRLSLGGALTLIYVSGQIYQFYLGAGPRIGYAFKLSSQFSLWPSLSATFGFSRRGGISDSRIQAFMLSFTLATPFLFHATRQVFVGLGPFCTVVVSTWGDGVDGAPVGPILFGLTSIIGGVF